MVKSAEESNSNLNLKPKKYGRPRGFSPSGNHSDEYLLRVANMPMSEAFKRLNPRSLARLELLVEQQRRKEMAPQKAQVGILDIPNVKKAFDIYLSAIYSSDFIWKENTRCFFESMVEAYKNDIDILNNQVQ